MKKIFKNNIVIIGLTFFIPGILALLCKGSFSNYKSLIKPKLSPPTILFPIVWSILYLLMSIAIILVKDKDERNIKIYYAQLILNAIWTPIFFCFKLYFIAFIELIILSIIVIYMAYKFHLDNKYSSYLLIPYILWNLFASYLNIYVALNN